MAGGCCGFAFMLSVTEYRFFVAHLLGQPTHCSDISDVVVGYNRLMLGIKTMF